MDMFTVLDAFDHIVCRSRLIEVVLPFLTTGCYLYKNGEAVNAY